MHWDMPAVSKTGCKLMLGILDSGHNSKFDFRPTEKTLKLQADPDCVWRIHIASVLS